MPDEIHHSDPLLKGAPDYGRVLFDRFSKASDGFSTDAVIFAATNMIIKSLRETYGRRDQVMARMQDLWNRATEGVLKYYDPVTNRRRSTIPFTQKISAPVVILDPEKWNGN